jgi:hypothetical protein
LLHGFRSVADRPLVFDQKQARAGHFGTGFARPSTETHSFFNAKDADPAPD